MKKSTDKLWNYYEVEDYYRDRLDNGTWPGYFSVEQVLEMMKDTLVEEGLSKESRIWELPEGYEKYMKHIQYKKYERAMKGL